MGPGGPGGPRSPGEPWGGDKCDHRGGDSPREGLGWQQRVRGWVRAHPPALPGFRGHPAGRGDRHSQGCHPAGRGDTQGRHCHHPLLSAPKAPTARGQPWDHPWGPGGGTRTAASLTRASSARGNCAKHCKRSPVSPRCDRGRACPSSGSLPAFPEPQKRVQSSALPSTPTKSNSPGVGSVSPASPPQRSGDVRHWNSQPELWEHGTLTRAQLSLPGTPGMAPSSCSAPSGASRAACSWAQSPHRVWGGKGSQGRPQGRRVTPNPPAVTLNPPAVTPNPAGVTPNPPAVTPNPFSPSAPRCSSRP